MTEALEGQVPMFDPDSQSGRMSSEPSAATEERTSEPCWKSLSASQNRKLLFLDLRGASGRKPESSSEMDTRWRGELTTLNIGESPSAAVESRLSWILQEDAPLKYRLSAKACQGILRRAAQRGKELPEVLRLALEETIARESTTSTTTEDRPSITGGG